ncbi:uncharacterized protein LOC135215267 isoform X2 [Macrobrachium nipponense]|uniref:uncharacterized protein LOC135215267 isoform X2 n=1 Tax=Macrobrachium nipponense TaxID=159736 RepID=UPI0030C857A9
MKILALLLAILPLAIGDDFTIRTLEKINSEESPLLRVCFDGHLTTDLKNPSRFKLQISNNFTQTVVPSLSVVSEQCQTFKINLEHYSGPTSFLLTLQNRLARKNETLGHGSVTVTLKSINFTSVWVGSLKERQDRRSVRIQHDYKASKREKLKASLVGFDTEKVFSCKSSPCYVVDVEDGHRYHEVQLCLSNVASTDTKGCQVCERKAPENSEEQLVLDLPEPDSIVLTYGQDGKPYISVAGPFDDATVSLEIVLYRGEGKTYHLISAACNASSKGGGKLCRSPNIVRLDGQGQYKVLLVALDQDGKVTHSSVASFENFATKVAQVSSDLIEVRWKAAEGGAYEVSLNQDVPGGYNNVTVHCGGMNSSSCSVYFTKLDQKTYEVQVKKNDSAHNAVARVTTLQEEIREHLRVFSVLRGLPNMPDDHMNLTVCIEETIDSRSYDLILIDRWGATLRTKSSLKGSHILCFPPVTIDSSSFDLSREVRILVKSEMFLQSFYGESELFLLGLSQRDDNKMLTVDQVGKRTVRVKWLNLNDGQVAIGNVFSLTEDAIVRSTNRISCQYRGECGKYLHFRSKTVSFQITEMAENLQIIHAQMHFANILPIKIISSTIDWAGRVKVCFHKVKEAYRYELGLELDHSTLIDDTRYPETVSSGDRQLCLLSQSQIDAGPDSRVTIIVSGLHRNGKLLAAGNDVLKVNFISSSRTVLAASAMDGIMASWGHMVPLRNNEEYHVSFKTLGSSKDQQTDVTVAEKQLFHRFDEEGKGDFAICVRPRVKVPRAVNGEACSDIIHSRDVGAPVLPVEEMKLRTASAEAILVTWKPPAKEDVSSYVVSWNLEYFGNDDELPAADRLLYLMPPSLLPGEFKILPAGQISWTLYNLQENGRYLVCVAAVKRGLMGAKTCGLVDLDSYYSLSYPLDVKYKKGIVMWDGKTNCTCHVEWKSLTEGTSNYIEVDGNSYNLSLGPGVWEITVRNVTEGVASGASKIHVSVEGIVISTKQTGQSSLTIEWSENEEIPPMKASSTTFAYEVTFSKGGKPLDSPTVKRCSGRMDDCSLQFTHKLVYPKDEISVDVVNLNSSISARVFHRIRAIEKIKSLSAKMAESDSAKVTWDEVYEATRYNYILYNNHQRKRILLRGSQPENSLQLNIPELEGCLFAVQVCIGGNICGDFSTVPLFAGTNENNIIFSFEVAIAGAAFFTFLILFAFRKKSSSGQTGRDGHQTCADAAGRIQKSL